MSPLPATGTVQVNVTLLLGENTYEYKTVTLPPGFAQDLEFYGAYTFAWVSAIYRDGVGEIDAVVNLEGACAATPGPTSTPAPTQTVTSTPTHMPTFATTSTPTVTPSGTPTSAVMPTLTPTSTPGSTIVMPTFAPTTTPASTVTPASTAVATYAPTFTHTTTPENTATALQLEPSPTADETPGITGLPNTGTGPGGPGGATAMFVATILLTAAALLATFVSRTRPRGH